MKKFNGLLLIIFLTASFQCLYAQELEQRDEKKNKNFKVLYVLKADLKTVEIDNTAGDQLNIDEIEVERISSIEILKDKAAIDKYGLKATNGVVIVNFRDFESLSEKTKKLFEVTEKRD